MDANPLRTILEDLNFSASLPADILDRLAGESTASTLPTGGVVFREGGVDDHLYLIRRGCLALEMNVPGRGAVRILTLGPGEMVGWSALLGQGRMTATVVAVEETEVVVAEAAKLRALCEADCEFGFHLMRQMADALSKRLVATRLQLLDLFADQPSPPATRREGLA